MPLSYLKNGKLLMEVVRRGDPQPPYVYLGSMNLRHTNAVLCRVERPIDPFVQGQVCNMSVCSGRLWRSEWVPVR